MTLVPAYDEITSCLFGFIGKRLSPEAFAALLPVLQSTFKILLIPSIKEDSDNILRETWSRLSAKLSKCNPEIRRAISEVWASVVRRLKKTGRKRCIELMMMDLDENGDVVAWSLIYASKVWYVTSEK